MSKQKIVFGTGGWRTLIGQGFDKTNVLKVVAAISEVFKGAVVYISYDHRFLSVEAANWAAEYLLSRDHIVHYSDQPIPTPVHMHYVLKQQLEIGLMITASHNPYLYNGIKVIVKEGRDAPLELTQKLEKIANSFTESQLLIDDQKVDRSNLINVNPIKNYVNDVIRLIDIERIKTRDFRVLIDPMHGVSRDTLQMLLAQGYVLVDFINEEQDAFFGSKMPAPEENVLELLKMKIIHDGKYDFGIATDADADRVALIDDKGRYLDANTILSLIYDYLLSYTTHRGAVVRNTTTTHLLDDIASNFNQQSYEVPVGFKQISQTMTKYDALLGGESSGGIALRNHIHGKDGIFVALIIFEMLSASGRKLSQLVDRLHQKYGKYYSSEIRVNFAEKQKAEFLKFIENYEIFELRGLEIKNVSRNDGLKIVYSEGSWVSLRLSGTEPLFRAVVESRNKDTKRRIKYNIINLLERELNAIA